MDKKLHIVSLDIPYPPDYGGMIDVFYKLKSLAELGIEITLHCFQYGNRKPSAELNQYCKTVYYYPRITGWAGVHFSLPYIVSSRRDITLLKNLLSDHAPILFEGLHSTYWLQNPALKGRNKILRAHNTESDYYKLLAGNTSSVFKKIYYYLEASRLLLYEKNLKDVSHILAISKADERYLINKYPDTDVRYVPAFHAIENVTCIAGKGSYCLYHGNLSVSENIRSVRYLIHEVFNDLGIPLIIAGKNPSEEIKSLANEQVRIITNPDESEMQSLIQNAHIHVLPGFQNTGIKLKLLHALFAGRFCITNDRMEEQFLPDNIITAYTADDFKSNIMQLMKEEFTAEDIEKRKQLFRHFMNETGAKKIAELL